MDVKMTAKEYLDARAACRKHDIRTGLLSNPALAEVGRALLALESRIAKTERDRDALRSALWGFDYNPDSKPGARGYFCSGCDVDGDDRATSPHHDDDCRAARAALKSEAP